MKTVTVHRAGDLGKSVVVEPVTIIIGESVDTAILQPDTLHLWEMLLVSEGNAVADALVDTLPQGVLHRVTVRLLERWVGSFNGTFMGPLDRSDEKDAEIARLRRAVHGYQNGLTTGLVAIDEKEYEKLKALKLTEDAEGIWLQINAPNGLKGAVRLPGFRAEAIVQRALRSVIAGP